MPKYTNQVCSLYNPFLRKILLFLLDCVYLAAVGKKHNMNVNKWEVRQQWIGWADQVSLCFHLTSLMRKHRQMWVGAVQEVQLIPVTADDRISPSALSITKTEIWLDTTLSFPEQLSFYSVVWVRNFLPFLVLVGEKVRLSKFAYSEKVFL